MDKRRASQSPEPQSSNASNQVVIAKKPKSDNVPSQALVQQDNKNNKSLIHKVPRTSSLSNPIIQLSGHSGEVFSSRFSSTGEFIASGSFDKNIFLWKTYQENQNYGVLSGHKGAVLDLDWNNDSSQLYSCSSDRTVAVWDHETGNRVKKFSEHSNIINSVNCQKKFAGSGVIVSGSDDRTIKIWDLRRKQSVETLEQDYQVTSVCFSDAGDMVFSGSLDNTIYAFDLKQNKISYTLTGHSDTITGLRLSPDGNFLLSNSFDNTVRIWDVRPFVPNERLVNIFEGAPHGFEKNLIKPCWSSDGSQIACGSSDRSVTIWDADSKDILYKLPGHKGCVNQVDFHPSEPIILSCSTDRTLFLGEVLPPQ